MTDLQEVDKLKLYFGSNCVINEYLTVKHPTVGEIVEHGEMDYYNMVYTLCSIPSDRKSQLWDMGIDWTELSDFEYFIYLTRGMTKEHTSILLGDLDLSSFNPGTNPVNGELILFKEVEKTITQDIPLNKIKKLWYKITKKPLQKEEHVKEVLIIDELLYMRMVNFIRAIHNITPKIESKVANKVTKELLIQEDRDRIRYAARKNKGKENQSILFPLVSSLCNSEGFKYKTSELKEIPIFQFMDSVQRIQVIKSADALLKGCYGGMIDTKNIDKNELNWFRDLSE